MGDFYELFFGDAEAAATALDIALTQRGEHGGAPIQMCGVPVHAADAYLLRLIRRGFRVAVAEQMEDPKARVRQGADPARGGAAGHPRHADRGRAAGGRAAEFPAGAGRRRPAGSARPGSTFQPACSRPRMFPAPTCRDCWAASIRRKSSRPPAWRWGSGRGGARPNRRPRRPPARGGGRRTRSAPRASMRSARSPMPRRPRSPGCSTTCA